jgi:glycosyltransferase involved in cell wall biosynthesis
MKKVAVITRTKNRPILLSRALESVKTQIYKDLVWVIVNDGGSINPVEEIASEAKKAGIETTLIHNESSIGMEAASNKGISKSQSEYLIIHDDDDSWEPDFLRETVNYLDSKTGKRYGGVVSHSYLIKEVLEEDKCTIIEKSDFNQFLEEIYLADVAKSNSFPPISFLYRRNVYDKVGGYNEDLPVLGDWDFNLRFLLESDIAVVPKPMANYHHRIQSDIKNEYANTVVQGINKHIQYDTILRNYLLREDIKNNRFGLGYLVTIERDNRFIINTISNLKLTKDMARYVKEHGVWWIIKKCFSRK